MKKYYEKYKAWRLELIRKWAQSYANLIIRQLGSAKTDWEFNYWMTQGMMHDASVISKYEIYLD